MAETSYQLLRSVSGTFVTATLTLELRNGGLTQWRVKLMNTSTTSTTSTKCTVYRGARNQIDFTRSGNGDTSVADVNISPGEFLTIVYANGSIGAIATFTIEGEEVARGRRAY